MLPIDVFTSPNGIFLINAGPIIFAITAENTVRPAIRGYCSRLVEEQDFPERDTFLIPCQRWMRGWRRFRASALSSRSTGRPRGSRMEAPDRVSLAF